MGLFRKAKKETRIEDSVALIKSMRTKAEYLIHASENKDITGRLEGILDTLKYLAPSVKPDAAAALAKIDNRLDDLKIALSGRKDSSRIENEIRAVELLLIERKSNY